MPLKTTRRIICVILSIIIAVGMLSFFSAMIFRATAINEKFIVKHFVSDSLVSQCNEQMNMKFEALEVKSSVPARVFKTVQKDFDTGSTIMQSVQAIFNEEDPTLFNTSMKDYFYNLCIEYLDGNNMSYNKKYIENTAYDAAKAYSESVGIHNTQSYRHYIEKAKNNCAKISSVSLLAVIIAVVFLCLMYTDKKSAMIYVLGGTASSGIAGAVSGILCIVFKTGANSGVLPVIYQSCFQSLLRSSFIGLIVIGAAVTAVSYVFLMMIKRSKIKETEY